MLDVNIPSCLICFKNCLPSIVKREQMKLQCDNETVAKKSTPKCREVINVGVFCYYYY